MEGFTGAAGNCEKGDLKMWTPGKVKEMIVTERRKKED